MYGTELPSPNNYGSERAYSTGILYERYVTGMSSGVGVQVDYVSAGILASFQASALYSYHYQISDQQQFSIGTRLYYNVSCSLNLIIKYNKSC